jgi:hypothetical protein
VLLSPGCCWATPSPLGGTEIFPPFIKSLSMRGAIYLQAGLGYVVPSRADGTSRSPERVVVSLGGIKNQQPWSQSGGSQKFCIHKFW